MKGSFICFDDLVLEDFDNIPINDRKKLSDWFVMNKHKLEGYYQELDVEQFQNEFNNGIMDYQLILIL